MTEWGAADGAAVRSPDRHPMTDGGAEEEEPDDAPEVPDVSGPYYTEVAAAVETLVALLGEAHESARQNRVAEARDLAQHAADVAEDLEADR